MRGIAVGVALLLVLFGGGACREGERESGRVVIAAGGGRGVYLAYGEGLGRAARSAGMDARVVGGASAVENLVRVGRGDADVAFAPADLAALAVAGAGPFGRRADLAALARLYDDYTHLVVASDSGIQELTDLRGRTVATGVVGSETEMVATRLLAVGGVSARRRHMGVAEASGALQAGRVDAFFYSGEVPEQAITELSHVMGIRLVDLGAYVGPLRGLYGEFYQERSIPASAYRLFAAPRTVGLPTYLVVSSGMPAGRARSLTEMLFAQKGTLVAARPEALHLNRRAAISTSPLALHPGAARYYRESKVAN